MSILSDTAILAAMEWRTAADRPEIVIDPFDPACLGGNSYDVHLSRHLLVYLRQFDRYNRELPLDCATRNPYAEFEIGDRGFVLQPNQLYLGSTVEYTETHAHVPYLDGRSSTGRLGISIHETAGRGDVGFCGHWTLEISVREPRVIHAGMRIGQLTFHTVEGEVRNRYATKPGATYAGPRNPKPVPSGMWRSYKERG